MAKFEIVIICALCFIYSRTLSAPIIKASGVQWSEPKGTGKGNITLIMIPQNNSCGNESDMIVAVKSDYQIVSQDTQLLNLVVNENTDSKTKTKKCDVPLKKCSSLEEDSANKQERELLRQSNTAKYFESENKLPSENTTNSTVNIYPALVKNYQNLVALNGTLTTDSYNTVNIFQLLSMSQTNNKYVSSSGVQISSYSSLSTATSKYSNNVNLTEPSNHGLATNNDVKSKTNNITLSLGESNDNFLNEALDILEKLKQDPSYYNKLKSNQVPSTEETKENGGMYLTDSKTKFLKSDDSALASEEGEGLGREFGHINREDQDISNLEGKINENIPNSTCFPFFMAVTSEQTTQLDLNNHTEIYLEKVALKGTGSNTSQELNKPSSKCKPLTPKSVGEEMSQATKAPIEISFNTSIGYGVQSNTFQTMSVKTCVLSSGFHTESVVVTPFLTSQTENGLGSVATAPSVSNGEPHYIQQTLAAAKVASGSELSITDSSHNVGGTTSTSISGSDNYASTNNSESVSPIQTSVTIMPPNLEQVNNAPSAEEMKSPAMPEDHISTISQPSVTTSNIIDQSLSPIPNYSVNGSTPSNLRNEQEIKNTACVSNGLLTTVLPSILSPISTKNVASGLNGISEVTTECVTDQNDNVGQDLSPPQAGVGAKPTKITLEPQVSCGTVKKEESSTISHVDEGQEPCFKDNDLSLPLVKSSIFLANNNDMPKGKDIPISLNASLDDYSLSDLQEKEDRMHGKVAELYNRNPIIFNVEHDQPGIFLKPQLKYYKSEVLQSPSLNFDKLYNPNPNNILKMNLAGKNVILGQRPSFKSDTNNKICNNTLGNNNKLPNYETEPGDSDSMNVESEPMTNTTTKITMVSKPNVFSGNEQKYLGTFIKPSDSYQPANEEEKLLTILNSIDQTTIGIKSGDKSQGSFTLLDVSTVSPKNSMVSVPQPDSNGKLLNPQGSVQNNDNVESNVGQQESKNSHINSLINVTTYQPNSNEKVHVKPTCILEGKSGSKPFKTKKNKEKTIPDFSRTDSSDETKQENNIQTKEKMCIPGDSVQKIVIEIVRNTKRPENKQGDFIMNGSYSNRRVQSVVEQNEKKPFQERKNIKQNVVPFQYAWKPVKTKEKQTVFPPTYYIEPNSVYGNVQIKGNSKNEIYDPDVIQEKYLHQPNINNKLFESHDTVKQEQIPTDLKEYNNPYDQAATNREKGLGANILKLLMADKSVAKRK